MSESPATNGYPVDLPSGGRYYESGKSRAVLTHIRGEQEALLADANPQTFPEVTDQILQQVTDELPVDDWGDMLIGDKYALLFQLRQISYPGKPYSFDVTCPRCSFHNAVDFDIKRDVDMREGKNVPEPFVVDLPVSGTAVTLRLMRVNDEREMTRFVRKERRENPGQGDPGYLYSIARGIQAVDGEPVEFDVALKFVKEAAAMDNAELKDCLDDHDVGPELEVEFSCQSCKGYWHQMMPLGADFFRPGSAKRRRAKG